MIDATDREILTILQENARTSNAEIARTVGLAPSAIFQRIRKLEESGVIQGYHARVDPRALGYPLVAFVRIQTSEGVRADDLAPALAEIPEVQEIHRVVGEDCFFVKVRVSDTNHLASLLDDCFLTLPAVASTKTTIVLTTNKETSRLELREREPAGVGRRE